MYIDSPTLVVDGYIFSFKTVKKKKRERKESIMPSFVIHVGMKGMSIAEHTCIHNHEYWILYFIFIK